jgi:AAA family ATP:ADP antiporter
MIVIQRGERRAFALSFAYFLLLLCSYYLLRPVRDALVSGLDTDEIKYLSSAVFIVMLCVAPLFGMLMARIPRRTLLPFIYAFFVVNLLLFAVLFHQDANGVWPARIFYVWVTVFNFFVVSVFWSFMADIWREEQGRRLFGAIAAGGSCGGLLGPAFARQFADDVGTSGLTLCAAVLLSGAIICLILLRRDAQPNTTSTTNQQSALHGSGWQGILLILRSPFLLGIASLVVIGSIAAMFAYTETSRLAKELLDTPQARTAFFAQIDLWTNLVALLLQAVIVGPLTSRLGVVAPLLGLGVIACIAFGAVALMPTLWVLGASNVARRAAEFGLGKPGRDMLYTVTTPQEKYLAKNVIDTLLARSGDLVGGWIYATLTLMGLTLAGFGWVAAGMMVGSVAVALGVVRGYRARGGL